MGIGETLAGARRRAGLTVRQVGHRARLKETIIRSIEDDDYAVCGGDAYARAHIRAIALAVGVDPRPLIRQYDTTRQHQNPQHDGAPQYHGTQQHDRPRRYPRALHHEKALGDGPWQYDEAQQHTKARQYADARQHYKAQQHNRAQQYYSAPPVLSDTPRRPPAEEPAKARTYQSPAPSSGHEGCPAEPQRRPEERRQAERRRIRQSAMLGAVVLAVLGFASYELVSTASHAPQPAATARPAR